MVASYVEQSINKHRSKVTGCVDRDGDVTVSGGTGQGQCAGQVSLS